MSSIPDDLRYTKEHEWVRREGDLVAMGITDYAQNELGDIIFLELPDVGRKCAAMEEIITVESVKAASEVYAPLAGEIVELNDACVDDPSIINKSPYQEGWFVKIRPDDPARIDALLSPEQYAEETGE